MKTTKKPFIKKEFDFAKYGCFFAFGDKQFQEQKVKDVMYVQMDGGLLCPKSEAKTIWTKFDKFNKSEIKRELKHKSKEEIIKYELSNHECYYTGDYSDIIGIMKAYGITEEEIRKIYIEESKKCNDY